VSSVLAGFPLSKDPDITGETSDSIGGLADGNWADDDRDHSRRLPIGSYRYMTMTISIRNGRATVTRPASTRRGAPFAGATRTRRTLDSRLLNEKLDSGHPERGGFARAENNDCLSSGWFSREEFGRNSAV